MSKVLQHLVSKNKRRIIINGFDLDLTYITDQIIAMGLPATGVSGIYRNPQGEVIRFLESFHGGAFRIYNLCKRPQDQYDPEKFGGSVECFPFEDHGVPPLRVVDALAASVQAWLSVSSDRVVCIHCLAGKGRTGLMVCAAMMKMGIVKASREAMAFYGERRMKNKKGVTQTSQRRWCEYYEQTLTGKLNMQSPRTLTSCVMEGCRRPVSLQLYGIDAKDEQTLLFDSGLFTERCEMRWTFVEDVCFLLLDEDGKPIAQMWLHATFINSNRMLCPSGWWDMEKNKKGKKLLKEYAVHLVFHDDGSWSEGAGRTLEPITDKAYRAESPGEYGELDPDFYEEDEEDDFDLQSLASSKSPGSRQGSSSSRSRMGTVTDNEHLSQLEDQLASRRSRMGWLFNLRRPGSSPRKASHSNSSDASDRSEYRTARQISIDNAYVDRKYSPMQSSQSSVKSIGEERLSLPSIPSAGSLRDSFGRASSMPATTMQQHLPLQPRSSETDF
mmetsp:Transcript_23000/g.52147  ORF Transcript_23000/g.52147 Transcript_23000/m.52147 type:complete len:499 (-) Transcript_23000:745-2241(-)